MFPGARSGGSAKSWNLGDSLGVAGLDLVRPLQVGRGFFLMEHRPQVGAQRNPFDIGKIDVRDVHRVFRNEIACCAVCEVRPGDAGRGLQASQPDLSVTRRQTPRLSMRKPAQFPYPVSLPRRDTCPKA